MTARFLVGDVFDRLAELPDQSVDLVLTSPPFLALRSYLPPDHPDKGREIGSEATPADFIDRLLDVVEACGRVLAPHGSLVFELGDTYAGSGGAGGDYGAGGLRDGQERFDGSSRRSRRRDGAAGILPPGRDAGGGAGWPLDKSLCGIPHLFHLSLAYGRNLLRPERTIDPWRVRNVVAWCRPNPPVGALGDKFRPATSYLTVATRARDRYFDLDAVRTEGCEPGAVKRKAKNHSAANPRSGWASDNAEIHQNPNGAPPLDWWEIPTAPYKGSHYATWPPNLLIRPILTMCPERVCRVCGEPSRRIVELDSEYVAHMGDQLRSDNDNGRSTSSARNKPGDVTHARRSTTVGWTDCGHGDWRPGVVLDPFAGSGTTLAVATGHGRDAVGIDLDARNAALAAERVGMFLDEVAS